MIRRIAVVAVVLLMASNAQAQVLSFPVESVPSAATVKWDAAVLAQPTDRVDGYRVVLDGSIVTSTVGIGSTSASFSIPSFGRHVLWIRSFNEVAESVPLELVFDVLQAVSITIPAWPNGAAAKIVLEIRSVAATGSPAPFTDAAGHKWTLVGTDPQIDGKHAGNAGASGTQLILLPSGVYVLAVDANWYRWSGTDWVIVGKIRPTS